MNSNEMLIFYVVGFTLKHDAVILITACLTMLKIYIVFHLYFKPLLDHSDSTKFIGHGAIELGCQLAMIVNCMNSIAQHPVNLILVQ